MRPAMSQPGGVARAALVVASLLLTSACGALNVSDPAPQIYTLTPKSSYPADLPSVDWQVGVAAPTAPAGLTTALIAVARDPLTLDYYAGARWVDDAPNMVQRLLIESFDNSGRIVGVGPESVALRSDFVLRLELREFQAEYYDGAKVPEVNIRVNVKLVKLPQRRIVAASTHEQRVTAAGNSMPTIVETFDVALGKVLREIVVWTLTNPALAGQ